MSGVAATQRPDGHAPTDGPPPHTDLAVEVDVIRELAAPVPFGATGPEPAVYDALAKLTPRHFTAGECRRAFVAIVKRLDDEGRPDSIAAQRSLGPADQVWFSRNIVGKWHSALVLPARVRALDDLLQRRRLAEAHAEAGVRLHAGDVPGFHAALHGVVDEPAPVTINVWPEDLDEVSRRPWLVPGWIPEGCITLLTGNGAGGKSLLALQLAVAVTGETMQGEGWRRVLPLAEEWRAEALPSHSPVVGAASPGSALLASWEDDFEEASRRRLRVQCPWSPADRLHFLSLRAQGALWGPDSGKHVATTGVVTTAGDDFARVLEQLAPQPRLVVVDPAAAAFGGDENSRALVRQFISVCDAWAANTGCAFILIAHPSKAAVISGSTDWRNGPRAVIALEAAKTPGVYEPGRDGKASKTLATGTRLRLDKANYGVQGKTLWTMLDRNFDAAKNRFDRIRVVEATPLESASAYAADHGLPEPVEA